MDLRSLSDEPGERQLNLIVNYLPDEFTEPKLQEMFSMCGRVQSIRIMRHNNGSSRGFGFVSFSTEQEAKCAIAMYNGFSIGNKRLKVAHARPGGTRKNSNVFVKNIPPHWQDVDLQQLFGQFGHMLEARFFSRGGKRERSALIRFDQSQMAQAAIRALDGFTPMYTTQSLIVKYAQFPKKVQTMDAKLSLFEFATHPKTAVIQPPSTICLSGLPTHFCQSVITTMCQTYGKVNAVKLFRDLNGSSLGLAEVSFREHHEASKASAGLNDLEMMGFKIKASHIHTI
jgi:RNA recognition motif-containing protein